MRIHLVLTPDGRALLTTEAELRPDQGAKLLEAFARWREGHETLLLSSCDIVRVVDVELDTAIGGE